MIPAQPHNPVSPEALAQGYMPEALRVRVLVILLIAFIVSAIALHALLWKLMLAFEARDRQADVPRSVLVVNQQPRPPNLQPSVGHDSLPYQDMESLREHEDEVFARLGWSVNMRTHEATIPPDIARRVAEEARTRVNAPPTTTGKDHNTILPSGIPDYNTRPGTEGGRRP